jgi:hypothetical protein
MAKVTDLYFGDRNDCTTLVLFCWSSSVTAVPWFSACSVENLILQGISR